MNYSQKLAFFFFDNAKLATVVDMESTAVFFFVSKNRAMRNVKYQISGNVNVRLTNPWNKVPFPYLFYKTCTWTKQHTELLSM